LTQFQDHEEAWTKVDGILEKSNVPQTKVKKYSLEKKNTGTIKLKRVFFPCSLSRYRFLKNLFKLDGILYKLTVEMV
jgi:hypothetical protein